MVKAKKEKKENQAKNAIDFMGYRKIAAALSAVLLTVAIGSLAFKGIKLGLDFTGGTLVEVVYDQAVDLSSVRNTLRSAGYEDAVVVNFGTSQDILVRLPVGESATLGEQLVTDLKTGYNGGIELKRIEFVGPQVGEELREQGGLGLLIALICIMAYVAFRFQYKFSVGAVLALVHDILFTLGCFSLFQWDFDLTVLAAFLAVIGYSLNDTIVVSDRIRENFRAIRKGAAIDIINISLTQTLGRTLVTSFTTLMVLFSLFIFGGEIIHGFATALIIGVLVGTYSSIFIAANVLLAMKISREDLLLPVKEGVEVDDLP